MTDPILIATPYPFNTSKSSHIECFSNDQGIILSLTIIAKMADVHKNISSLQYRKDNITKNGSIILIIPAPFNYSQLYSKIECHSKYYHGSQKISSLEVLSVAEIPQKEYLSKDTYTKQIVTIQCLTYGTNVFIHWDFTHDMSKDTFSSLPIGIRIENEFTTNDTLIIDHVSYSDHHGYYRCSATNKLLGITYEDESIISLDVKKNSIWLSIVIVCVMIGICILILIFCSKYCHKRRKSRTEETKISQVEEEMIDKIEQTVPDRELMNDSSDPNKQTSFQSIIVNTKDNILHLSHSKNSMTSQLSSAQRKSEQSRVSNSSDILKKSPQFVLGNPFLDPNVQPNISIK